MYNVIFALAIAIVGSFLIMQSKWSLTDTIKNIFFTESELQQEANEQSGLSMLDKQMLFSRSLRELEIEFRLKHLDDIEYVERTYYKDQQEGNFLIQRLVQAYLDEQFDKMVPLALRSYEIHPDQESEYIRNFRENLQKVLPAQWADAAYIRSAVHQKRYRPR